MLERRAVPLSRKAPLLPLRPTSSSSRRFCAIRRPATPSLTGKDGKLDPDNLTGLAAPVAASTNATYEAYRLAIRNGSIFLDGGDDFARRTIGFLYGIQSYGGSPAPFVPGCVTDASGLQKVLLALYLFLFGLALRNMLKMK